LMPQ